MSKLQSCPPNSPQKSMASKKTKTSMDIQRWIDALKRSDNSLYKIIAMESWSLAKTMDEFCPGFWHRFMLNRQIALKQIKTHKQQARLLKIESCSTPNSQESPSK